MLKKRNTGISRNSEKGRKNPIRKNIVIERLMKPAKIINEEKIDEEKE